jgi:excisionase family DNA binding protein
MTIPTNWLTAAEAATYLKVEPRTLLMWARQRKVKGYVLSGTLRQTWRFQYRDLDAALMGTDVLASESPSVAHTNGRIQ